MTGMLPEWESQEWTSSYRVNDEVDLRSEIVEGFMNEERVAHTMRPKSGSSLARVNCRLGAVWH